MRVSHSHIEIDHEVTSKCRTCIVRRCNAGGLGTSAVALQGRAPNVLMMTLELVTRLPEILPVEFSDESHSIGEDENDLC